MGSKEGYFSVNIISRICCNVVAPFNGSFPKLESICKRPPEDVNSATASDGKGTSEDSTIDVWLAAVAF